MNKISARDIWLVIAGALALDGLQALLFIPYYFIAPMEPTRICGAVIAGLALPIGIGIFLGRWSALWWAQVYLWLKFISACFFIPVFWYFFHEKVWHLALKCVPGILAAAVLLGLIFWTTSERFRHEPDV